MAWAALGWSLLGCAVRRAAGLSSGLGLAGMGFVGAGLGLGWALLGGAVLSCAGLR